MGVSNAITDNNCNRRNAERVESMRLAKRQAAESHGGATKRFRTPAREREMAEELMRRNEAAQKLERPAAKLLKAMADPYSAPQKVAELLRAGMDANARDDAGTPLLSIACEKGNPETVRHFLEAGADVNAADRNGGTPLMRAVASRSPGAVKLLLEKNADVNRADRNGWTALMRAAAKHDAETVKAVLAKGADARAENTRGWNALHIAESAPHRDFAGYLATIELLNE